MPKKCTRPRKRQGNLNELAIEGKGNSNMFVQDDHSLVTICVAVLSHPIAYTYSYIVYLVQLVFT